jgi:uncharacterized OB-fold protein
MTTKMRQPALGAEGWFTPDDPEPALLGLRCTTCGTYVFPRADYGCPSPACDGTDFDEVRLSRRGRIWSYTNACYQPPAPYVVPHDEHEPFCIAAVELADEGLVVMGQLTAGVTVEDLRVGQEVELVVDVLFSDDEADHLIWKWRPMTDGETSSDSAGGDR